MENKDYGYLVNLAKDYERTNTQLKLPTLNINLAGTNFENIKALRTFYKKLFLLKTPSFEDIKLWVETVYAGYIPYKNYKHFDEVSTSKLERVLTVSDINNTKEVQDFYSAFYDRFFDRSPVLIKPPMYDFIFRDDEKDVVTHYLISTTGTVPTAKEHFTCHFGYATKVQFRLLNLSTLYYLYKQQLYVSSNLDNLKSLIVESEGFKDRFSTEYAQKLVFTKYKGSKYAEVDKSNTIAMYTLIVLDQLVDFYQYLSFAETQNQIRESAKVYAKSFQTKQNINLETQYYMENNSFLQYFTFVELDNDIDLEKFKQLDNYFATEFAPHFHNFLPKNDPTAKLRFRRLGKQRTTGVYYHHPSREINDIVVDIHKVSSFVHELGHYLDFRYEGREDIYSLDRTFINNVVIPVATYITDNAPSDLTKSRLAYYTSSTEVLARAFEVYVVFKIFPKGYRCPFTNSRTYYEESVFYQPLLHKRVFQSIVEFMERRFLI